MPSWAGTSRNGVRGPVVLLIEGDQSYYISKGSRTTYRLVRWPYSLTHLNIIHNQGLRDLSVTDSLLTNTVPWNGTAKSKRPDTMNLRRGSKDVQTASIPRINKYLQLSTTPFTHVLFLTVSLQRCCSVLYSLPCRSCRSTPWQPLYLLLWFPNLPLGLSPQVMVCRVTVSDRPPCDCVGAPPLLTFANSRVSCYCQWSETLQARSRSRPISKL
jgi:hypothetical protein